MNSFAEAQQEATLKNAAKNAQIAANPDTEFARFGYGSPAQMQTAQTALAQMTFKAYENTTYPKGEVVFDYSVEPARFAVLVLPTSIISAWDAGTDEQRKLGAIQALTLIQDMGINYLETLTTELEAIFI